MFRSLGALLFLVLVLVTVGYFRSWFTVSKGGPDPVNHKVDVHLSMDRDKVEADARKLGKATSDLVGGTSDPAPAAAEKSSAPGNEPGTDAPDSDAPNSDTRDRDRREKSQPDRP